MEKLEEQNRTCLSVSLDWIRFSNDDLNSYYEKICQYNQEALSNEFQCV